MKCGKCNEKYPANIDEPAPGGSNSPGTFFVFNVISIIAGCLFVVLGWQIWFFVAALALFFGLVANILIYISFLVENGIKGVSCPKCDHKNWIYPWSF